MKYKQFIFESYEFNDDILELNYSYDGQVNFREKYKFDFDFADYNPAGLDRALRLLFLIAGVSYYKIYLAPEIIVKPFELDQETVNLIKQVYQKGLGEFFYVNGLDPKQSIPFKVTANNTLNTLSIGGEGVLVGLGGGKDSLVSTELLRQDHPTTWSLGHKAQLEPLIKTIGLPHLFVERTIDPQLLELKHDPSAYNGHIPISAIFAATGVIVAILSGHRDVVVSNESTASEPNLTYKQTDINHQYSKSLDFEIIFKSYLNHIFGDSIRYYSLLRPLTELRIAELFAGLAFDKYSGVFSSCNRAFVQGNDALFWCGKCPKCAFAFLILTPFVERDKLELVFGGKNLLLDPALDKTYRELLGIEGNKPLECVGEIKESRAAMALARKRYPELDKYQFDLPADYDYKRLADYAMPPEIFAKIRDKLSV